MAAEKILIVDDEKNIVEAVRYNLERDGYRTLIARDGAQALELARRELPHLILLDWMLPVMPGLEVCRALKADAKTAHIPIIMLTVKSDEADKVVGLEMGADDYVTKPFSPRELLARVKALLRRRAAPPTGEVADIGELRIDRGKYLVWVQGKAASLTAKEFALLTALIDARGRVLTREALLETVWGYDRALEIETRTVDLHVSQLRKKLRQAGARIVTVKSAGYRFVLDE